MERSEDQELELSVWVDRLKDGDEEAAHVIWQHCFEAMKGVARSKMGPRRGCVDEEDVALSAMNSFMVRCRDGRFKKLNDREDLWRLLFTITVRKSYRHTRDQMTAKRRGEVGESQLWKRSADESLDNPMNRVADPRGLAADQLVSILEEQKAFDETIADLGESLQAVAVNKLAGSTNAQIAQSCGCSERTVERKLHLIREIWADSH